jgi:prolyl oligopeptidase
MNLNDHGDSNHLFDASNTEDPYLWLEAPCEGPVLEWVKAANAPALDTLGHSTGFEELETTILEILNSKAKIPYIVKHGDYFYNHWRDAENPRGLWRRTTLEEYRKPEPAWETVLDLDVLGKEESQGWVFHGSQFLRPGFQRCLVSLSPGGSDAVVVREFDVKLKAFVPDGFAVPLAKTDVSWIDADHLFVCTDFGPGSMTTSGYPRIAKIWTRGTPLEQAVTVFEGAETDMAAGAFHDSTPGFERDFIYRRPTFFTNEIHLLGAEGSPRRIAIPDDAEPSFHREWMTVTLRTPWDVAGKSYPAGSLLVIRFDAFMEGNRAFTILFEPSPTTSLASAQWTRHHLILNVMDDVKNRLSVLTPGELGWERTPFAGAPAFGTLSAQAVDEDESDAFFMTSTDFLTPDTLSFGEIGAEPETLKSMPAFFEASGLEISQHFVQSKDGTRVPYFLVAKRGLILDGSHPTLLTGYGGFEVPLLPYYSGISGRAWLGRGGVFAVANIRGGGEYGPGWHQAALKQHRHRAFEDFAAVAQDLIARKITAPRHLGILGGSNGGLLVGNMLTAYPDLFGAIVCQIPLLDMKRYSRLLAGASWMEEYGDPDQPEDWAYLQTFSPYHNVKADTDYPPVFFMTTSMDDRVHPGHARKMFARMRELGHEAYYFENIEGGHGAGADNRQMARFWALAYAFLFKTLA